MKIRSSHRRALRSFSIRTHIGPRCRAYAQGCACCEAWRFYDNTGRWPRWEELAPILKDFDVDAPEVPWSQLTNKEC